MLKGVIFIIFVNLFALSVLLVWPLFWLYIRYVLVHWFNTAELASAVYEEDDATSALTATELALVDLNWDHNVWLAEDIVNYFLENDELDGDTPMQMEYEDTAYAFIDYLWFFGLSSIRDYENIHFSVNDMLRRNRAIAFLKNNPTKVKNCLEELKKKKKK